MRCEFKDGSISRNEGLKETKRKQNIKLGSSSLRGQRGKDDTHTIFQGPC